MTVSQPDAVLQGPAAPKRTLRPKSDKPSRWLWVPFIWLFFASTRTLSTWMTWSGRGLATGTDVSGSPLDQLLMTALMLLGLVVLGRRWERTRRILARNKWVVVLFVYMALSIVWSNFPGLTLRRCARSSGTLLMVLVVLTEEKPLEAVRALLRRLYLVFIPLSVFAIKYYRNIGVMYNWNGAEEEWTGLSVDKNSLGQVAMLSGLFWLWQLFQDWTAKKPKRNVKKLALDILLLAMSLWLLHGSKNVHSSTAILGFVTCTLVLIGLQFIKKEIARSKRVILASAVAFMLLGPIVYLGFELFDTSPAQMVLEATGRDMTLTDRTLIWTDVLNDAAKSPVLGVGMGAFWVGPMGYDMYPMPNWSRKTPEWRPEEGHDGYIDVYAELGVVGVALLLMVIVNGFTGAFADLQSDFKFGSLRLVLLLSIIMNNVAETSFLKGTHDLWFLFLLVSVNVPKPVRKAISGRDSTVTDHSVNQHEQLLANQILQLSPIPQHD